MSQRPSVLIVDDEPQMIRQLARIVGPLAQIRAATSAQAALRQLRGPHPPDLVLLDVTMPEMNGITLCHTLKADPLLAEIPVIFVTGRSGAGEEVMGFQAGAVDYVAKPIEPLVVRARVGVHLALRQQARTLAELAHRDGLTGVANRRRFDAYLLGAWARSVQGDHPLSLLMIDLDHFKAFNDRHGHLAGDECLRAAAQAMAEVARAAGGLLARYGGEEFSLVAPGLSAERAVALTQPLRAAMSGLQGLAGPVTISVGVAERAAVQAADPAALVAAADAALYQAKQAGRDRAASAAPAPLRACA